MLGGGGVGDKCGDPVEIDTGPAQRCGACKLLRHGVRPASERREVAEAALAVIVGIPAVLSE